MENYQSNPFQENPTNGSNFVPSNLPNATAVLILGILAIIGCCFYGSGVIFGIIALVLAKKDMKLYKQNPNAYANYSTLNIGRILAIIGIVLFAVSLIATLAFGAIFGWEVLTNQELMQERIQEWAEQQGQY
ncbi:MAG TPA: CCC motif membrane protein [Flavobacterium sp.]|nr:CCC motif membrane protein [Flavobacterium sp.]